jgi:uncharacterized protein YcaQ
MAVTGSLADPAPLADVMRRLEFVQYDPIRRPARAQDLILHQRVRRYRAGDLDRAYDELGLEEDYLHVYGAMTAELRGLLHPRPDRRHRDRPYEPEGLAAEVLAFVRERGQVHPRDLAEPFGAKRAVNAWGGMSAASTRALEQLHHHGLLRIAARDKGVKLYEPCDPPGNGMPAAERLRELVVHAARTLAPISETALGGVASRLRRSVGWPDVSKTVVADLLRDGALEAEEVDGVRYIWPAGSHPAGMARPPRRVRFLAPFDPVVWDRARFEHLWGWPYRFEAYTPAPKRQFGYYALPLLVGDRIVGWANCEPAPRSGALDVEVSFAGRPLRGRDVRRGIDREVARLTALARGSARGLRS